MKTILVLIAMVTATITGSVIAENSGNMMPPPGPYRSMADVDQYGLMQKDQNDSKGVERRVCCHAQSSQSGRAVPEWMRQRQAQIESRMQQLNMPPSVQGWNNPPSQWNYNQRPPMTNTYSGQMPVYQNNRMQQPFPSARGPVYGPGMAPPDFYRQPMQQAPRY